MASRLQELSIMGDGKVRGIMSVLDDGFNDERELEGGTIEACTCSCDRHSNPRSLKGQYISSRELDFYEQTP